VHVTAISSIIISGIRRRGAAAAAAEAAAHAARSTDAGRGAAGPPLCHQHFAVREARIVAAVTAAERAIKNCKQRWFDSTCFRQRQAAIE
jgi:hypothetical protein